MSPLAQLADDLVSLMEDITQTHWIEDVFSIVGMLFLEYTAGRNGGKTSCRSSVIQSSVEKPMASRERYSLHGGDFLTGGVVCVRLMVIYDFDFDRRAVKSVISIYMLVRTVVEERAVVPRVLAMFGFRVQK